jgi:hypothetical protein
MFCVHVAGDEFGPRLMISARMASPFRSMDVTSISPTMHLRVSPTWRASIHLNWSSTAHRPTN